MSICNAPKVYYASYSKNTFYTEITQFWIFLQNSVTPPPLSPPPKHQNKNVCKYFYKIFMLRLWWSYNKLLFSHHYCIRTSLRIIVDKTTSLGANIFKWKSFCFYFYFILINSIMSNYFILTLDNLMWEVIIFMRQKIILHIN